MSSCVKCGEICKCLTVTSPDGSIIINKKTDALGCVFELSVDADDVYLFLEFNNQTRQLCIKNRNGVVLNCVIIPEKKQFITLNGDQLCISDGNCITLPPHPYLNLISQSIRVEQSGPLNHNAVIEVEPSTDAGNSIVIGSDGKIYARNIVINSNECINFTQTIVNGNRVLTPTIDLECVLNTIKNTETLRQLFCSIVATCETGPVICNPVQSLNASLEILP